ncbi:MAG: peptidylprolyl isomerase [Verrucomicrobia bacterium]|nr:peptidylprolyl isomerase [Verrucomicrobiota bacterium]
MLAATFCLAQSLPAQTGLPTLSRQIPAQVLNRGPVQIDLTSHFGAPGVTGQIVQFNTTLGRVNIEMQATEAPRNVANFLSYVAKNAYDNTLLHRVDNLGAAVPSIVQGGGYPAVSLPPAPAPIERSAPVPLEYRLPLTRGTLAAAHNPNEPNGATSEWFFNTVDNSTALGPNIDGGYTVFGRVLGTGMSVIDAIAQTPTASVQGTVFSKLPVRNVTSTQTQLTPANYLIVSTARVIPVFPPSVGDPTALLSFVVTPPATSGIITATVTGSTLTLTPLAVGTVSVTVRAADANGNTSLPTTFTVTVPPESLLAPVFTSHPSSQTVSQGSTVVLSATAIGGATDLFPLTYQWLRNGEPVASPSSPYLVLRSVSARDAGVYACRANNALGGSLSTTATLNVVASAPYEVGRLVNLAIRTAAGSLDETLIVGFAVGDNRSTGTKPLLIRGVGPSLAQFGVRDALPDPVLQLYRGSGLVAENDNWRGDAQVAARSVQVGAFAFSGPAALDAAVAVSSTVGSYTVQLKDRGEGSGTVLAEVYDATPGIEIGERTPRLVNLSARAKLAADDSLLVAGFVIGGTTPATVLIRAVGPSLAAFGVAEPVADPKLQLYRGTAQLTEVDNWEGEAQLASLAGAIGAFALPATGSKDAALLVTLPPGTYTAQVSDVTRAGGIALIEVYEIR